MRAAAPEHRADARLAGWNDGLHRGRERGFVIVFKSSTIGKIGAYRLPQFGYILSPAYWGLGLASEAMTAFLDHAFTRPDISRLIVDIDPRNLPSLGLVKRHGFVEIGRASGTWNTHIGVCDSIYLALERADHLRRRG